MKKLFALFICAVLVFSLAACSGNENNNKETTTSADVNISETENSETTQKEEETENNETTQKEEETKKTISRGTIADNVYTNEFAEFTFTKPSTWIYLTDEEISENINEGQKISDLNFIEKTLSEKASLYDMAAMDNFGNNVMICYENTMLTGFKKVTAEEYLENLDKYIKSMDGVDFEFVSNEDIKFGDTEFKKAVYNVKTRGVEITQAYYIRIIDKYAVSIVVSATKNNIAEIEAMFG